MLKAIFAIDHNGGMGNKGSLPWPHDSEDMRWFKQHTSNQVVIMGSSTWLDPNMPSPLPNRTNVVISDQPKHKFFGADYIIKTHNLRVELPNLKSQYKDNTFWVIGGPTLLTLTRDMIDEAYVTHYHNDYESDAKLDAVNWFKNTMMQQESFGKNKTFRVYKCSPI